MQKRLVETDRFVAVTPTGDRRTIIERTAILSQPVFGGVAQATGLKQLKTADGRHVNYVGPGEYQLLDGTKLKRV
jgi:hypothetical protein